MRVLITGGAGFIGSHTADALLAAGHQVRILDILDPQIHGPAGAFPEYLDPRVEAIRGDVRSLENVSCALGGIDAVYHLAALTGVGQSMYDMHNYTDTNTTGTATLLEAILKSDASLKRIVLASSRAVYGEGTHFCTDHGKQFPAPRRREDMERGIYAVLCPECHRPLTSEPTAEDRPLNPISMYAWTKKHQEDLATYAARTFGLPVTILRYFNVFGSRQSLRNPYTGVVSIFYSRLLSEKPISLYERGTPERDFVHISDVVAANLLALEANCTPGTCINVGTGRSDRIGDVASALAHSLRKAPVFEDRGEFRVGDIHACVADLGRAHTMLGYEPRVGLIEGMQEFVAWAQRHDAVDMYQKTVDELTRYGLFGQATKQS
ncbi:NAD-dependent epimerase/dehydratase family protein [Aromatoleum evansii]|uniref:NAD-dependent epimerase/dehydratase family protein n=1 Tax=Aromatoleum evansii TaxID=59406 RepID=UPI00145EBCCC|nr:NAD-dependent epimerase/dehydratase family protein [Aromatoleum evansii]NMG30300.1 SDR family NAD(P)-dependent oxidoreductase [Aromatoleum evansii]